MKTLSYTTYFDRVFGCFLGKTISGTIGAPYEGVKMAMELPYKKEMVNTMLPNDDLDLQILWLDVIAKKGADFAPYDLLERFCTHCDYSPGEYAVMRKNFGRGIYPPYSGILSNDYYKEGMGCPIRSEIWACVAPLNPALAAEFASRDGQIDHDSLHGESVIAEEYFAALESLAFGGGETEALILEALSYIPSDCKFAGLVRSVVGWCEKYGTCAAVLRKILYTYGHPDCTNLYQNMGITLTALLLGERDIIKTSMMALNCGFDTDCTCASAGSVIGILLGAEKILAAFDTADIRFKTEVRTDRTSDSVRDLSRDIAEIGVKFTETVNRAVCLTDAPAVTAVFALPQPLTWQVAYDTLPSLCPGESLTVRLQFTNHTKKTITETLTVTAPTGYDAVCAEACVLQTGETVVPVTVTLRTDARLLTEKNSFTVQLDGEESLSFTFGIVSAMPWKVTGPLWRTEPPTDTASILSVPNYYHLIGKSSYQGNDIDKIRHFHVNMEPDFTLGEASLTDDGLFADVNDNGSAEEREIFLKEDAFDFADFLPFCGACTFYMTRKLYSPIEQEVCIQIGHSQPYTLWLNGEKLSEHLQTAVYTSENYHLSGIRLKKGINYLKWRITRTNADTHMSILFSEGATCATHILSLGAERFR